MSDSWSLHRPSSSFNDSGDWSQIGDGGDPSSGGGDINWGEEYDEAGLKDSEMKNKLALIYLIDFTVSMQQNSHLKRAKKEESDNESVKNEDSCINQTIDAVVSSLKYKIVASPDDLVGIALMGTNKQSSNTLNVQSIHMFMPLQQLSASVIKSVMALKTLTKQSEIGMGNNSALDLLDALRVAHSMFTNQSISNEVKPDPDMDDDEDPANAVRHQVNQSKASLNAANKTIMIFTCQDYPAKMVANPDLKGLTVQRAKDMRESDIQVSLVPFHTIGQTFDVAKLYKSIIAVHDDESFDAYSDKMFDDLLENVRRKSSKKRALGTMKFTLGAGVELSIKLFCLYREMKRESPKFLATDNSKLTSETKWVDSAGGFVEKEEMLKYYPFGTSKAYLTDEELKEIKTFGSPGLQLMGFKPIDRLKPFHNYRSPYFLQPDDSQIRGSGRAFYALLLEMAELQKMAVVRLIYRTATVPRLAVLLPQLEELDDGGAQVQGPGFHCVFLPFADDIRNIKASVPQQAVEIELVNLAHAVINKLSAPSFEPSAISNPILQRHFAMVEARALDENPREVEDDLQPHQAAFEGCIAEQTDFVTATFQSSPQPQRAKAERVTKSAAPKKRAKSEMGDSDNDEDDEYTQFDWALLKQDSNSKGNKAGLGKLTIPQLKVYLTKHGLEKSGRKDDLVTRILNHQT